jgi:hypothetical protein
LGTSPLEEVPAVDEAGPPDQGVFLFHVMVDGEVVSSSQSLSPEESKAVREICRRYNGLFEGGYAPRLNGETMAAQGAEFSAYEWFLKKLRPQIVVTLLM